MELRYDFSTHPQVVTTELIVKRGMGRKKRVMRYEFEFDANAAIMSGGQGIRPQKVLQGDENKEEGDVLFDKFREGGALLLRMEEMISNKREKTFSMDVKLNSTRKDTSISSLTESVHKVNLYEVSGGNRKYLCSGE